MQSKRISAWLENEWRDLLPLHETPEFVAEWGDPDLPEDGFEAAVGALIRSRMTEEDHRALSRDESDISGGYLPDSLVACLNVMIEIYGLEMAERIMKGYVVYEE